MKASLYYITALLEVSDLSQDETESLQDRLTVDSPKGYVCLIREWHACWHQTCSAYHGGPRLYLAGSGAFAVPDPIAELTLAMDWQVLQQPATVHQQAVANAHCHW